MLKWLTGFFIMDRFIPRRGALFQHWRFPGNHGVGVYTQKELNEIVLAAHKAGMQVACHAMEAPMVR